MSKTLTLEEYLREKSALGVPANFVEDRLLRLKRWLEELEHLIAQVKPWLDDLKSAGPVSYYEQIVHLNEEVVGHYDVSQLKIFFGTEQVLLKPVGTDVFGALGRVDLIGKNMTIPIVMREWGKWEILQREFVGTAQPTRNNYRPFDSDSFKDVVLLLIAD